MPAPFFSFPMLPGGVMAASVFLKIDAARHSPLLSRFLPAGRQARPLHLPQTLSRGDPGFAKNAYAGRFVFDGEAIEVGSVSPFAVNDAPAPWRRALFGFQWLKHLEASGTQIARIHAKRLVSDWLNTPWRNRQNAWSPSIVATRLTAWLEAMPFLLEKPDTDFEQRVLQMINAQILFLALTAPRCSNPLDRLNAAIGLAVATICMDGHRKAHRKAMALIEYELGAQLLADGGHITRAPTALAAVLSGLTHLRALYAAAQTAPPQIVISAIDRMVPALRFFLLGNHKLARFNGKAAATAEPAAELLQAHPTPGEPLEHARFSGYHRAARGDMVLIMDAGQPATAPSGMAGHAGCLAFELSIGAHPVIVNCGVCTDRPSRWYDAMRATAAHSTLTLDGENQGVAQRGFWPLRQAGANRAELVRSTRSGRDGGILIETAHELYASRFGLTHSRSIYISSSGDDLRGEDVVSASKLGRARAAANARAPQAAVRFHLHPDIKATQSQGAKSILLVLPNRSGWLFDTAGGTVSLEESICLTETGQPRRTQQIVIHGLVKDRSARFKWALKRLDAARKQRSTPSGTGPDAGNAPALF